MRLVRHVVAGGAQLDTTADTAWANYVRFLFEPNFFYFFPTLSDRKFIFIARNRAAPGRQQVADGDATGRLLTHAWFELVDEYAHEGVVVAPVTLGQTKSLQLRNATVAEILRAAGHHIPVEGTARDMEVKYEKAYSELEVLKYTGDRFDGRRADWFFVLTNGVEVEEDSYMNRQIQDLTKMALARRLQVLDGSDDETRNRRWELTKDALIALLVDHAEAGAYEMDVAEIPRGRGRGRGGAKAKPKARGRGGRGLADEGVARGGRGGRGRGRGRARGGGGRA